MSDSQKPVSDTTDRDEALEQAAAECDRHAEFLKKEAHAGGNWEHLMARWQEATYNAKSIRKLKDSTDERVARINKLAATVIRAMTAEDLDDDTMAQMLGVVVGTAMLTCSDPKEAFDVFRSALYTIIGDRGEAVMKALPVGGRA